MSLSTAKNQMPDIMAGFEKIIAMAPDEPQPMNADETPKRDVEYCTGLPKRYRADWDRPTDQAWVNHFSKIMDRVKAGGIVALIGNRGTGKTRLAAEAMRSQAPAKGLYTTAMGLFLRIRSSFGKTTTESEESIVKELSTCLMLIIDEVQERGNTPWEDRLLTHILDRRYGAMLPTIIIANLAADALTECLGDSISSRINETGGIITINGKSFRDL